MPLEIRKAVPSSRSAYALHNFQFDPRALAGHFAEAAAANLNFSRVLIVVCDPRVPIPKAVVGELTSSNRTSAISNINNGERKVLIISDAAVEGISLIGVKNVIFVDLPWTYAAYAQVVGRAVRLNSHVHKKDKKVAVYNLIGSIIDSRMLEFIKQKRDISENVIQKLREKQNL